MHGAKFLIKPDKVISVLNACLISYPKEPLSFAFNVILTVARRKSHFYCVVPNTSARFLQHEKEGINDL